MCVRERVAIGEGAKIKPGSAPRCFFSVKPHHGIKTLHFLPFSSLEKRACLRRALRAARGGERAGRRAGEDTAVGWPSRAKSAGSRLGRSGRKRSAAPSAFSGRVRRARSMSAQKASHEAAAGAWAGLVGTVLGYPLDVVKSRMQTAHAGARVANATNPATSASVRPRGVPGGAGFVASFTKLAREEGLRGAYRGLGPPVCMMMLMNAVNFTAFNRAKEALGVERPAARGSFDASVSTTAGAFPPGRSTPASAETLLFCGTCSRGTGVEVRGRVAAAARSRSPPRSFFAGFSWRGSVVARGACGHDRRRTGHGDVLDARGGPRSPRRRSMGSSARRAGQARERSRVSHRETPARDGGGRETSSEARRIEAPSASARVV